jgi:hypothetical protein
MLELAILFSFKSHAIAVAAGVLGGGLGGFLLGGKVEQKAQAAVAKASGAISAEVKKL